jgi:hypothetical protein
VKRAARGSGRPLWLLLLSIALAAVPAFGSGQGFDRVVSSIERQFSIQRTHVPMMGFASFCADVFTRGGVKNVQIAQFDSVGPRMTPEALDAALQRDLGEPWRPLLKDRERDTGDNTFVYARIAHGELFLMVADLQNRSLSLVQLHLNEKRMAAWVQNPEGELQHRRDAK